MYIVVEIVEDLNRLHHSQYCGRDGEVTFCVDSNHAPLLSLLICNLLGVLGFGV